MIKISNRLSKKLSLTIMLMAAPVFMLSLGIFYIQSQYLIRQEAIERSNSILRTMIQRVTNFMNTLEVSTNANAWLLEENFRPDSLQSITRRIVRLNPRILSCMVCTEPDMFPQYGHYFSAYTLHDDSITTVCETDYNYTDRAWYKAALSSGKGSWVEPFSEHAEGAIDHNEAVATYCRPLRSERGHIIGVIATDFLFSNLAKTINSAQPPYPDAYFMLLGGDGRYFIHPDTTRLFRKTLFTDADPQRNADRIALGHEMTEGKQGTMHVSINGQNCHVSYHPVPGTNWSIAMVCPEKDILEGYHRMAYVVTILIIVGLLAILWLCHRVVRQTVRPINQLLGYTKQIANGIYNEAIPHTEPNDDIGQLQNSFAAMVEALHNNMGSISRTAEKIRKQNEQRAHLMQMAEESVRQKAAFIQNLSHQIRTPLNIITGFANVLCDKRQSSEESLSEIIDTMKYNAIHLKRMVLMLFDCSSATNADELTGNRRDEVSCNEVSRESINYVEEHFQGIKIKLDSELSDGVEILTNRLYLMRSIRELLYNAAKYSDGKNICLHLTQTDTTVRFIVEDTGPGLRGNTEEQIYKPFIKIDQLSEDLGLGLPLCKRHAKSLGGDLIHDASYTDGCRIILELPK